MLNDIQTLRQLLFDLTANYLEPLPDTFSRLAYVSGLRDSARGAYTHARLATVYAPAQIDTVLAKCHEELFERLLEMPLAGQEKELRKYLSSLSGTFEQNIRACKAASVRWIPPDAPSYLKELFHSNLNVLQEILLENKPKAR